MVQVIQRQQIPSTSESLFQGLGQGLSQGLNDKLAEHYEEKKYQKDLVRQNAETKKFYEGTRPYLKTVGLQDSEIDALEQSNVNPQFIPHILKQKHEKETLEKEYAKIRQDQQLASGLYQQLNEDNFGSKPQPQKQPTPSQIPSDVPQNIDQAAKEDPSLRNPSKELKEPQHDQFVPPSIGRFAKTLKKPIPYAKPETMLKLQDQKIKDIESLKKSEEDRSRPFMEHISKMRGALLHKENAQKSINRALESGEVDGLDGNYLADILGFEPFRNKAGTQLLTAVKDYFINDLQKADAKPNMFLEKQIRAMNVEAGRGMYANMATSRVLGSQLDLDSKQVELADELEQYYRDELGFVPSDIDREVQKRLKPYNEFRQNVLSYEIQDLYDKQDEVDGKLNTLKKVRPGTPLTARKLSVILNKANDDEEKAREVAEYLGYKFPEDDIVNSAYDIPPHPSELR